MSPDEFESWKETIAVRTDLPLMQEIKEGLKALKSKKTRLYTLEELRALIYPEMKQPIRKLKVPDSVAKLIRDLHPHLKKKIKASLQSIITDPYLGKALKDELAGLRSFRVSRFRIIYRISDERLIEIIA